MHTRPRAHRSPGIPCALNSERAGINEYLGAAAPARSRSRDEISVDEISAGDFDQIVLAPFAQGPLSGLGFEFVPAIEDRLRVTRARNFL